MGKWSLSAAIVAGFAGLAAQAQVNTFEFVVSNVISPEQQSATVEVWAEFDESQYAFHYAALDVFAEAAAGGFVDPERMLKGPGTKDGVVSPDGDAVLGIIECQLHFPIAGIHARTDNPILLWRTVWSTADFTPREISVTTLTSRFDLFLDTDVDGDGMMDGFTDSFLDEFVEGQGVIQVVPAPGGLAVLVVGGLVGARRRGSRGGPR